MDTQYIDEWLALKQRMAADSARELELREYITATMLQGKTTGSVRTIFDNVELKATAKQYTNVDTVALDMVFKDLTETERNALRYKPEFIMREYNKLPPDSLLRSKVGVVKQAKPTLELVTG